MPLDPEDHAVYDALNEHAKNEKKRRLQEAQAADDGGWTKHTKHHWSR